MELRVAEAIQYDGRKGVARIDPKLMEELGMHPGDVAEISGGQKTVAVVDEAYPDDVGLKLIRMGRLTRRNAKTRIDELVEVQKAEMAEAERVVLEPFLGRMQGDASEVLRKPLLGMPLYAGSILQAEGRVEKGSLPLQEAFKNIELAGLRAAMVSFRVAQTVPEGPVIVTENTKILLETRSLPQGWLRFHKEEGVVELDRETLADMLGVKPEEIKEGKVV